MGNILLKVLIVEYIVVAIAYILQRDFCRFFYFIGATIISLSVLFMQ